MLMSARHFEYDSDEEVQDVRFSLSFSAVCLRAVCWPSWKVTRWTVRFVGPKEGHFIIKKLPPNPGQKWGLRIIQFSALTGSRNMSSKVRENKPFDGVSNMTSISTFSEPDKMRVSSRSWINQERFWLRWFSSYEHHQKLYLIAQLCALKGPGIGALKGQLNGPTLRHDFQVILSLSN